MIFYARHLVMNTNDRTYEINDRADALISHIVDGEASPEQWRELERFATGRPRLWRELAESQRDAAALRVAMTLAGDIAQRVALPHSTSAAHGAAFTESDIRTLPHPALRFNRFGAWTGWLVAAVIILVASVQIAQHERSAGQTGAQPQTAGAGAGLVQSAADAWDTYLQRGAAEGSVLGEVPGKMVVESRPMVAQDGVAGGYEVIFVRQVVERAIVPDLYQISGEDERGQPTLTRYRQAVLRKPL
jgi:hypothetical protein